MRIKLPYVLTFMILVWPAASGAQEKPTSPPAPLEALRTWAVLCDPAVQKSGLDDLLLAQLSQNRAFTLVDRQQLDLVAKEMVLTKLADSAGVAGRMRVGKILKADALVLLTQQTLSGQEILRLVICDSQSGARLRVEYIPQEGNQREATAKAAYTVLEDTRKRFAEGVRQTYGISPFICRNLVHDFDKLQTGIPTLLAAALSGQKGVAVIEVEEARLVAKEFNLTGGSAVARVAPLFVEGEYEVTKEAGAKEPTITLRIKIIGQNKNIRSLPERKMRLSEVARYLNVDVPALLMDRGGNESKQSLSDAEQLKMLCDRAEVFAQLGHWEESASLREAALLLQDDPLQRIRLVEEYRNLVAAPLPPSMRLGQGDDYISLCRQRWQLWYVALAHLEYLVRNRQVDARWAPQMVTKLFFGNTLNMIYMAAEKDLVEAEQTRRSFIRNIYGPMTKLVWQGKPEPFGWWDTYSHMSLKFLVERPLHKEDLDFLYEMMTQVIPDDDYHRRPFWFYPSYFSEPHRMFDCTEQDFLDFLARLEKSDRWVNRCIARYSRLHWECPDPEKAKVPLEPLLEQVKTLHDDFARLPAEQNATAPVVSNLEDLQRKIERTMENRRSTVRPVFPPTPKPPAPAECLVKLEEIPLRLRRLSGKIEPFLGQEWKAAQDIHNGWGFRLVNCGSFDVVWAGGVLLFHREKGVFDEILVDPQARFRDVRWDGEKVWVASGRGEILVLSKEGKELVRVTEKHGLPPSDLMLLLHPLGKGKAIAVGSFGPHQRLWCGLVDITDATPKVTVFHQAIRVKNAGDAPEDIRPDLACLPEWVYEHQWTTDGPKVLLVGRYGIRAPYKGPSLLEIDLSTLTVDTSKAKIIQNAPIFYSHNGYLVQTRDNHPVLVAPPGKTFEDGKDYQYLGKDIKGGWSKPILFWKGRLFYSGFPCDGSRYITGIPWLRIKPGTWETESLQCEPGSSVQYSGQWGVSAHYGIVKWNSSKDPWYRAVIKDMEPESVIPTVVPPASRPAFQPAGTARPSGAVRSGK